MQIDRKDWVPEPEVKVSVPEMPPNVAELIANPDAEQKPETEKKLTLYPGAPMVSAREYVRRHHTQATARTLHHQGGSFFTWMKTHYCETPPEDVRAKLYGFLDQAVTPGKAEGETMPFNPNKAKVGNVIEALAAVTQLPATTRPPAWLDGRQHPSPADVVACSNGLLHMPSRELLPHSSEYFCLNALEFGYQPDAPEPQEWLKFLNQIWPNDDASISMLQEIFGLLLTSDTSYQKAFLIVGPKRSGKGTIARVLLALLGRENVAGPTLSSLGQNFGLAPIIGKRLAIISDARLGGKSDQQLVVERILSITGEDTLSVDRKFREAWTGRLESRFLILTNELPRLSDASGALASRFMILLMTHSFYGREDQRLTERLIAELPGILNWSLDGLARLNRRGYFVQPASATEAQRDFEDLGSPIGAFVRDCCVVAPDAECRPETLYSRWLAWCNDQHIMHPGTVQTFGGNIRSVVSSIKTVQHRQGGGTPERFYQGVKIRGEAQ